MENTKIANASVIAMGMVVGIHTAGREIATLEFGSVIWWWCALGMYGVFQIAVPFFFFCSGYFLAKHIDEDGWYCRECKKRIFTLFVPYLIWGGLYAALQVLTLAFNHGWGCHMRFDVRFWGHLLGLSPFGYPLLWPMWYVRTLMIFIAISPALKYLIRKAGAGSLFVLFLLSTIFEIHAHTTPMSFVFDKTFSLFGLFFFTSGMFLRMKPFHLPRSNVALFVGVCVVMASTFLRYYCGGSAFPRTLCATMLIIGAWKYIPEKMFPRFLVSSVFAVFALHPFIFHFWNIIVPMPIETVSLWLVKWFTGFCGPVVIAVVMRQCCPRSAMLMFGRR